MAPSIDTGPPNRVARQLLNDQWHSAGKAEVPGSWTSTVYYQHPIEGVLLGHLPITGNQAMPNFRLTLEAQRRVLQGKVQLWRLARSGPEMFFGEQYSTEQALLDMLL